jgi:hypothetical protein
MRVTRGCILFVVLFQCDAFSQGEVIDTSFLDRFSISITGNYHYAPWTRLNETFDVIQNVVNYIPNYANPHGYADKITGDASSSGFIGVRVADRIDILLSGSYLRTASDFSLRYVSSYNSDEVYNYGQKFGLNVSSVGGGIRYEFAIQEGVSIYASCLAERAFGRMHFEYDYAYSNLNYNSETHYTADLRSNAWSGEISTGVKVRFWKRFAVLGSLQYRLLRFRNFVGSGIETYRSQSSSGIAPPMPSQYQATLVESDHYFGVGFKTEWGNSYVPWWDFYQYSPYSQPILNSAAAKLDLSGVGGNIGFELEF